MVYVLISFYFEILKIKIIIYLLKAIRNLSSLLKSCSESQNMINDN